MTALFPPHRPSSIRSKSIQKTGASPGITFFLRRSYYGAIHAITAAGSTRNNAPQRAGGRSGIESRAYVVPAGSLQNENGIDTSRDHGANIFNGTNSRWRLGIASCLEVLVDLPTYVTTLRGAGPSGFGDIAPAVKWQISPVPGKFDLSITAGAALPTGATDVSGPGVQPYLQFPW